MGGARTHRGGEAFENEHLFAVIDIERLVSRAWQILSARGGEYVHPDDAEDLVHDAILAAFQRRGTFRRGGSSELEEWLAAFMRNAALHLRRRPAHGAVMKDDEFVYVGTNRRRDSLPDSHVEDVLLSDRGMVLTSVMAQCLNESEHTLVVEHYLRGTTVRTLAADVGVSAATIIRRMSAGLERIRKELFRRSRHAEEEWL